MSNLLSALLALAEDGSWVDVDSLPQDIMMSRKMELEQSAKLSGVNNERLRKATCRPGRVRLYPRKPSGVFHGSVQRPQAVSMAMPSRTESDSSEILIQDEAIWDSESIQMLTKARRAFEAGCLFCCKVKRARARKSSCAPCSVSTSRASEPLVPVNCAAIPEGLQEAEMFGYRRGGFYRRAASGQPRLHPARRGRRRRSFWMRLATCRWRCRRNCCACCRTAR